MTINIERDQTYNQKELEKLGAVSSDGEQFSGYYFLHTKEGDLVFEPLGNGLYGLRTDKRKPWVEPKPLEFY
ncbi:MAG: hypothetical protein ABIF08_00485 [Nanoarchaeota archaeon]